MGYCDSAGPLGKVLLEERVVTMHQVMRGSVKDEPALMQNEEAGLGVRLIPRQRLHPIRINVEAMAGEHEGVL